MKALANKTKEIIVEDEYTTKIIQGQVYLLEVKVNLSNDNVYLVDLPCARVEMSEVIFKDSFYIIS